jgi:hypothetical protein
MVKITLTIFSNPTVQLPLKGDNRLMIPLKGTCLSRTPFRCIEVDKLKGKEA